jgi:hypothetical protein
MPQADAQLGSRGRGEPQCRQQPVEDPAGRAARLLRHAYVLTMANCHVLLGYPLLDIPSVERARGWVS